MTFEELKNKHRKKWDTTSKTTGTVTTGSTGSTGSTEQTSNSAVAGFEALKEKHRQKLTSRTQSVSVDDEYINSFFTDYNNLLADYERDAASAGYNNAFSLYSGYYNRGLDLNERGNAIKSYLYAHRDMLDAADYQGMVDSIDQVLTGQRGITDSFRGVYSNASLFDSEDDYNAAIRQWGYQQTYQGKSYDEIQALLGQMEDGEEKAWLTEYGKSSEVMNADVYQRLVSEKQAEVEALQQAISDYRSKDTYGDYDAATQYDLNMAALSKAEQELEELQAGQWSTENAEKYAAISQAPDFNSVSSQVSEDPTTVFGLRFGDKFLGWGDPVYDYINDIDGARKTVRNPGNNVGGDSTLYKYNFMDNTEIATYNYIYNTEGKKAANEYLNYLSYDLDARVQQEIAANNVEFATDHPVLASVASVPANLMSGIGLVDVVAQNAIKDVKEAVTGEYAGPINYNSMAMSPNTISTSIRGTVAKNITDATGTIQINPAERPVLSRLLNGKSWGDVYQLGMSMADSAAVALLSPAIGSFGTVLLGGSAGTQGMLEAVERGATDGQALTMGILNGAFEMLFEKVSLDNLLKGNTKNILVAVLQQGFVEGTEEFNTSLFNTLADVLVMAKSSNYQASIAAYMEQGMSEAEASRQTMLDLAIQMGWDFVGGMLSGGIMGGVTTPIQNVQQKNAEAKAMYGDFAGDLVGEALELNPDSNFAHRMQGRLDAGKDLSGGQLNRLVQKNEKAIMQQDISSIEQAAVSRLQELGETGDVEAIAKALAKRAAGKKLTSRENQLIQESKYGRRLVNELNPENIRSGEYSTGWAQQLNTNRINPDEYSSYVEAAQKPQKATENTLDQVAPKATNAAQTVTQQAPAATIQENRTVADNATVQKPAQTAEETAETPAETVTLEAASQKYGAQAQAMIHTYTAGQDVAKYDAAYKAAYNMGKSGVNISYAMKSEATSYLTESQRELAHEAGAAASNTTAQEQDAENKAAANGKTGRKTGGVVRGEGVTMQDIKAAFHDTRGTAYKSLSTIAKVTGINIVLYKSETDADGNFMGAQGKYYRNREPGTIYIDINAGLETLKDVGDLEKYTVLRTFSHEFTHFIERWNPIQYNEFRKVVFDTLTERGEDVEFLIEQKQNDGLDYEAASREVVAEAMTDILPDANFVQELAEKHKNIFTKLLEKLKEFVENLRAYFTSLGTNRSREANALKEQIGDTVKYLDSIVKLFDQVAVQAVETYQQTVAQDVVVSKTENTTTVVETSAEKVETVVEETAAEVEEKPVETKEPVTEIDPNGFTITDNIERGSLKISFEGKPSEQVRDALKEHKFRWNGKKKVWYGYGDRAAIVDALHAAYEAEKAETTAPEPEQSDFEKAFWNATQAERDEVVEAITENTNITHMAPTEIREEVPAQTSEEVTPNGENADNQGTVQQPVTDGRGTAQVLDELQTGDVPGDGSSGNTVADAGERGQQTVRDGSGNDAERNVGGHGEGSSQSGDLRRDNGLTSEEPAGQSAEQLHEEVVEQIAQQSTEKPKGRNFVIGDSLDLPNGEKARYKANIEAIRLVKRLEAERRYATEAEQAILSKYVGWGGLANAFDERKAEWSKEFKELKELLTDEEYSLARGSTLNAHYTDISVIKAMYDGLKQLGFNGGRMMEPSSGVGNFVGAMPADMSAKVRSWTMVELDGITGLIAKHLYPNADVRIQGFEKAKIPNDFMDVAISNVPFGNYAITDKSYPKKVTSAIHNYFFAKSLDKVRPGGIVMFITSSYTMNSKDSTVRRYIMQKADLLGAIRLPDTAFKGNAGTEVVTDILILKKRAANTDYAGEEFLEAPYQYISGYQGAYINTYFENHPEMVLGTATMEGSMYRGASLTYKALEGKGSLADQIREAFTHITAKMDYPAQVSPEKTNFAVERAGKKTKENGLVVKDGKVYRNTGGELVEQTVAKGVAERISGMLEIRDAAKELQTYLQQGLKDSEIKKARAKLNKAYDAFVKKHGFLNSQANRNAIKNDPDSFSILALENYNPETKKATKADVFSKNTIAPNRTVTSAKDVAEGLIVSVNQTGGVDTALIAKLTGKAETDVARELIDSRAVFKNRDGELETAEVYLSGNVRAKLRDAEALVPMDADYQKNVEALRNVLPEDVPYQDIFVNPGAVWIPDSVYSDFAAHMLGTVNHEWNKAVDIVRNKETGNYTVELKNRYLKTNSYNTQKWGTNRRSFLDLFDAMLNSKSVVVKYKTDDGKSVVDKDATAAANEKVENIQKEFQEWLWQDEGRRGELATLYNETFNSIVTPTYNGDNLTVNGANAMKPLRPHQRNAVQRVISSGGNTLLAHKVGAGKTYEMAAAAMKLKQLGLVKKPMFAVPKSLVAQWGNEFVDFFPTAKLLVAEASDFTAANRKVFANRIANGDYDAVILSYEQFERLPISADFARELYQEQIDSIIRAIEEAKAEKGGKSLSVKDLEKKRKSLQAKIDKLTDSAKDEDNIEFEQLGVDSLFIDEAHNFKNLFYTTSMTNVSGLGNKDGSKRAFDLYTKVRYLQKLNGGRGIVFATATPVMNSMSEMYIMQKYLQPDLLDQLGLSTFDAWAKQFGEVVNGVEIKPSGQGYRVKQSFSRFKNMSELQLLFRNFADVLTDIPGLKIPKMKGGKVNVVVCEPGQFQQDYMKELEQRADNIKNVDPSVDNMLKITSDGRKISYTQRMIDPSLPYEEGCKIFRCADNVVDRYKASKDVKGTQLIFCDMATPKGKSSTAATETEEIETDMESAKLYDDIRARLIRGGIPAKEIAFIHEADTDAKKKKLFADVNDGKVRVLIGSTGKMGVGMNAQKRIVAIHHLDAPWRPGDVEQRNGRAYRQGNINDEVENFTYVTEGSFDARLWDILERKQNFINQVMNGENVGRETEDTGEVTLSAAEVKALASGSPLIMEQVQLDTDIKKLESLRRAHYSAVANAKSRLETDKGTIQTLETYIAAGKKDVAARVDTYSEGKFAITVGKTNFFDKKEAGIALMAEATAKATEDGYTTIGKFAGFDLRVVKTHEGIKGLISGNQGYSFNTYPGNTTFMINHLIGKMEGMSETINQWEQKLTETRKDMAEQEKLIAQPFAKQADLDQKRTRYKEVMEILNPKEEQAMDSVDEDAVQEQSRKYLKDDKQPTTAAEWSAFNRSFANQTNSLKNGETRPIIINTADHVYLVMADGYMSGDITAKIRIDGNEEALRDIRKEFKNGTYTGTKTPDTWAQTVRADRGRDGWDYAGTRYTGETGRAVDVDGGQSESDALRDYWEDYGYPSEDEFLEAVRDGVMFVDDEGNLIQNGQFQQRTSPLTDREVLALAATKVKVDDMTAAEKDALDIFQKRLVKLEDLQSQRAEQGRLYKEQQFGTKVDRAAAAQTLNRMHTLDEQIQRASAEVLSVEEKTVLKRVLQKARTVVEQQERQHGQEILKRWRDRRNDAAAIKKYRDRLRGDVDELTNWILHPDNKSTVKHIPDALKETVIPFLSSINFMSKRSLTGGNHTQADKAFMEQMRRLAKVMENTADIDEMYSNYTDLPPDFMKNLRSFMDTAQSIVDSNSGDFIINQMTAEELAKLSKVVRTLKKYIMQMNRFHVNSMFQHVHEAGENSIDFLGQLKPAENTGGVSQFLLWQQMRPAYAFERFGEGGQAIYDGLRRGQATLAFNTKKIMEFSEKAYTTAEVKAWENQIKTIRLGPGKTVTMRVSQIMSLYELNKREQAKGHILGEGIRVATFKDGRQKISDVGQTLTPGELNLILKQLTPRQMEVADKLQQFMEKQGGAWGNHVTVARFGEKQFGEEHYFPINSDGRHLSVDADEKPGAAALYALLNMGFTKQTQENAKNRIVVYSIFDVFSNHMASMAQYNAFALPVVDALKWFNYQRKSEPDENGYRAILGSVREQMDRAFGVPEESRPGSGRRGYAQNFVINIIKAFNGTEAQGTPYDEWGMKPLRRYNRAQVAYNFRVVMQQPLAITRAAMLVDYASIIKGMKLSPAAIQQNIREMREYSGIAAWKALGFYDVNISRGLTSMIKHDDTALDKIADVGMWGAEKADTMTWAAIWSAAKEEVKRKQHLYPKDAGYYEAVTKLFEDIIYKTQVVDSVLTKNEFMRDKGFLARAIGSFMSEPTTTASMLVDAFDKHHMDMQRGMTRQQAWKKNGKRIVRTVYVYGLSAVILAAVQAVADAFRDDDDYQTFIEKWLEAFGGNLVDELMPFNKLPIASDFYELAKELISVWGVDTFGNPPQTVFMQWYDVLVDGWKILNDKISGEETNYTWYGGAYKLLQAISGIAGLPMAAATREIVTAWNNIVGAMAPSMKIKTYEPGALAQIKYAYEDGYLTDDEAIAELIEQGLVDTEAEAYWTVQGWEAGEGYSRYDAIFDAVRNGGDINAAVGELTSHGYKAKDVLSQIKSEIGAWYRDGKITKQQATQMLTKYFDLDAEEITATVNQWSSVVVTGIEYGDIKQEFIDGNITAQRAIEMRMRYGGDTQEEATETVTKWRAEKETGIAYDDIDDAFMKGELSEGDARNMYVTYGGYSQEEASEKVAVMAFVKKHPDVKDISYAAIESYTEYAEAAGVPVKTFYDAWKYNSNTDADVDENGKSISGSKKAKVLAYINNLSLTYAQKDALYYSFGWAESKIYEAPWH